MWPPGEKSPGRRGRSGGSAPRLRAALHQGAPSCTAPAAPRPRVLQAAQDRPADQPRWRCRPSAARHRQAPAWSRRERVRKVYSATLPRGCATDRYLVRRNGTPFYGRLDVAERRKTRVGFLPISRTVEGRLRAAIAPVRTAGEGDGLHPRGARGRAPTFVGQRVRHARRPSAEKSAQPRCCHRGHLQGGPVPGSSAASAGAPFSTPGRGRFHGDAAHHPQRAGAAVPGRALHGCASLANWLAKVKLEHGRVH